MPHPVSRDSPITSAASTEIRRHNALLFIKSFPSQCLGSCCFSAKLPELTCRTSLPARVCSAKPAHGNDAAIICVRPVLQSPIPQKSLWKRHRHSTTTTYKYYITIATRFQQKMALKQSRSLTVAQTAAKRTIRADPPFA